MFKEKKTAMKEHIESRDFMKISIKPKREINEDNEHGEKKKVNGKKTDKVSRNLKFRSLLDLNFSVIGRIKSKQSIMSNQGLKNETEVIDGVLSEEIGSNDCQVGDKNKARASSVKNDYEISEVSCIHESLSNTDIRKVSSKYGSGKKWIAKRFDLKKMFGLDKKSKELKEGSDGYDKFADPKDLIKKIPKMKNDSKNGVNGGSKGVNYGEKYVGFMANGRGRDDEVDVPSSGSIDIDYRVLDLVPEEKIFCSQKKLRDLMLNNIGLDKKQEIKDQSTENASNTAVGDRSSSSYSGQSSITIIDKEIKKDGLDLAALFRVNASSIRKLEGNIKTPLRNLLLVRKVAIDSSKMISILKKNTPLLYYSAISNMEEDSARLVESVIEKSEAISQVAENILDEDDVENWERDRSLSISSSGADKKSSNKAGVLPVRNIHCDITKNITQNNLNTNGECDEFLELSLNKIPAVSVHSIENGSDTDEEYVETRRRNNGSRARSSIRIIGELVDTASKDQEKEESENLYYIDDFSKDIGKGDLGILLNNDSIFKKKSNPSLKSCKKSIKSLAGGEKFVGSAELDYFTEILLGKDVEGGSKKPNRDNKSTEVQNYSPTSEFGNLVAVSEQTDDDFKSMDSFLEKKFFFNVNLLSQSGRRSNRNFRINRNGGRRVIIKRNSIIRRTSINSRDSDAYTEANNNNNTSSITISTF
ncbi:hypothetical protein AYI70_g4757 [Smittium culicis]|uniref:Uncharacterized protein n=1 Tax=Smittium culicis TaxID=133412 RepID=A0A1R1XXL1_9FUNG|nr:hypothetical protein AYI70_g4927 [Smittium culicis]OMJ19410.1 hypothetical protein AYI70_g4757 [Smittium culicis]